MEATWRLASVKCRNGEIEKKDPGREDWVAIRIGESRKVRKPERWHRIKDWLFFSSSRLFACFFHFSSKS